MNILQRIFTDYYEEYKYTLHPRTTEMEKIDTCCSIFLDDANIGTEMISDIASEVQTTFLINLLQITISISSLLPYSSLADK